MIFAVDWVLNVKNQSIKRLLPDYFIVKPPYVKSVTSSSWAEMHVSKHPGAFSSHAFLWKFSKLLSWQIEINISTKYFLKNKRKKERWRFPRTWLDFGFDDRTFLHIWEHPHTLGTFLHSREYSYTLWKIDLTHTAREALDFPAAVVRMFHVRRDLPEAQRRT